MNNDIVRNCLMGNSLHICSFPHFPASVWLQEVASKGQFSDTSLKPKQRTVSNPQHGMLLRLDFSCPLATSWLLALSLQGSFLFWLSVHFSLPLSPSWCFSLLSNSVHNLLLFSVSKNSAFPKRKISYCMFLNNNNKKIWHKQIPQTFDIRRSGWEVHIHTFGKGLLLSKDNRVSGS